MKLTKGMSKKEIKLVVDTLITLSEDYLKNNDDSLVYVFELQHPTSTSHYYNEPLTAKVLIDSNGLTLEEDYFINEDIIKSSSDDIRLMAFFNLLQMGYTIESFSQEIG